MKLLHSDYMTRKELRIYIGFDRKVAQEKGIKHYLSDDDIRHIRKSLKHLGVPHEDFGYNLSFDLVHAEMDNETWKCFVPEHLTEWDKKEMQDEMWIHAVPSQYDCTGQRFTHWVSFYEVPTGTWIYHSLGYDY